jgi:hypothetical protein
LMVHATRSIVVQPPLVCTPQAILMVHATSCSKMHRTKQSPRRRGRGGRYQS